MDKWELQDAHMVYIAEGLLPAYEQNRTVGKNIKTLDDFRAEIEGYAMQGYILYVKGIGFEFRSINDLFTSKVTPALGKVGKGVYMAPRSSTQWRFVLHDLPCMPFNDLYAYYKDHIRISLDHQFLEDYVHMGHSDKGHVPVVECLFFLHHWKLTMDNLFVIARTVAWNRIYLAQLSSKEVVVRELDLWVYLGYWDKRLRSIPPPLELFPICYKGPATEHAFIRLSARLCHSVFFGVEQAIKGDEEQGYCDHSHYEEFKVNYGEYFLSQTPYRIFMKKEGLRSPDALEKLKGYGWTASNIGHMYPDKVEPNWWNSKERARSAVELRGPPNLSHSLSWEKISKGDMVELYALVASVKDRYLTRVTNPILLQGFRESAIEAGPEKIVTMISEAQRSVKLSFKDTTSGRQLIVSRLGVDLPIITQPYTLKEKVKCKNKC